MHSKTLHFFLYYRDVVEAYSSNIFERSVSKKKNQVSELPVLFLYNLLCNGNI